MAEARTISIISEEIVEAGRRFGNSWAELKEKRVKEGKEGKEKWFDNMVVKLDSPTAGGFHTIIRKMIREMAPEEGLRWGIKKEILGFISDKTRVSWRHAFLTGVYFGYYGYFKEKRGGNDD